MKILKLTFKNINNLKGKHVLSFDARPLSDAGIFAITGPTGSGKSTILDVITLSLFNKVPRFKNASNKEVVISKKQIQDHGSIMTHHTNESYAAIEYEINRITYTSEWTLSKTKAGNLKDYEMSIYDSFGKPLDLKKSEVPAKNEEIIGLNYTQFVKSILLSQGEFSKFLKANKNDRGKLLESITGSSIYRKIGVAAFEKEKESRESIQKAREHIGVIEILSNEKLKEIEEAKNDKISAKLKIDQELAKLSSIQTIKSNLLKKKNQLSNKNGISVSLKEQEISLKPLLLKLSVHEKLSPLQGKLAIYNEAIQNKDQTNENLKEYKASYKNYSDQLEAVIKEMAELTRSEVDVTLFKKIMADFEKEINDLDRDLKELKTKGTEERNRINIKSNSYPIPISTVPKEASEQLLLRQKDIKSILLDAQLSLKDDVGSLKEKLRSQRSRVNLLQNIHRENDALLLSIDNLEETVKDRKLTENKKTQLQPKLKSASELKHLLKEKVELLLQKKSDAERIERLEDIRDTLVDGQACPLCGAKDHPYSSHKPSIETSEIKRAIDEARNKLSIKEQEVTELEKLTAEIGAKISITDNHIEALKKQRSTLEKHIESLTKQLNGEEKIEIEHISSLLKTAQKEESSLDKGISALEEYKLNKELFDMYQSLNDLMVAFKSKRALRQEKYQGDDISALCNTLQDRYEKSKTSIERLKVSIQKEESDLRRAEDLVNSIRNEISPQISELGFNDLATANKSLLQKEEVDRIRWNKEELAKSLTSNKTEISLLEKEINQLLEVDTIPEKSVEDIALNISKIEQERDALSQQIGQYDSILKRDKLDREKIVEKENEINILNKEFEKWSLMKKLIGDANGNNFANFAQGLTLQNLLVFANKRLSHLSDRYLLDMPTQEDILNVVDQYQGNTRRAVNTLSGGESFLISLALALSLSDMASQNVSLDSLFIDEGFGSLDQETLDVAISTLEKLQSEGQKTVGVISHVEALKERINVQIRLNKNIHGYSEIDIIS